MKQALPGRYRQLLRQSAARQIFFGRFDEASRPEQRLKNPEKK